MASAFRFFYLLYYYAFCISASNPIFDSEAEYSGRCVRRVGPVIRNKVLNGARALLIVGNIRAVPFFSRQMRCIRLPPFIHAMRMSVIALHALDDKFCQGLARFRDASIFSGVLRRQKVTSVFSPHQWRLADDGPYVTKTLSGHLNQRKWRSCPYW